MKKLPLVIGVIVLIGVIAILNKPKVVKAPEGSMPTNISGVSAAFKNVELSPELNDSFQKGLMAAEQKGWDLAIKYFTEVQEKAPLYSPVYFNLGLVSANKGLPLKAMAWFKAYLAANPNAKNRKAIEDEIVKLEVATQIKKDKLFGQALEAAKIMPETSWVDNEYVTGGRAEIMPQQSAYQDIYRARGIAGDIEEALKISQMIKEEYYHGDSYARRMYAEALVDEGYLEAAEKELQKINDESDKNSVLRKIADHYLNAKKYTEAYKVMKLLGSDLYGGEDLQLVTVLFEGGNAQEALAMIDKWEAPDRKLNAWNKLVISYIDKGKGKEAKDLVEKAYTFAREKAAESNGSFEDYLSYANPLLELGQNMLKINEPKQAEAVLDLWSDEHLKMFLHSSIAKYYAEKGDAVKAEAWISKIYDSERKIATLYDVGTEFAKQLNWEKAEYFLSQIYGSSNLVVSAHAASFAVKAWQEERAGNSSGAKEIINGLSSDDRDRASYEIVSYACFDKNFEKAEEYASSFANQYWRRDAYAKIAYNCIEKNEFDRAYALVEEKWEDLNFKNTWGALSLAENFMKYNRRKEAAAIIEKVEKNIYTEGDRDRLEEMAKDYKELGFMEGYNRVKSVINVLMWVGLAKEKLKDVSAEDMQASLQKVSQEKPYEVPVNICWIAQDLAKGLRLIKLTQLTNRL